MILSQRDKRWATIKLGTGNLTIGSHGCAITSVAMIAGTTPDLVNAKMPYVNKEILDWAKVASQWGLKHSSVTNKPVWYPVIAETTLSGSMHFILVLEDGTQLDPWTGKETRSYKIKSYRNLKKENNMTPQEKAELTKLRVDVDFLANEVRPKIAKLRVDVDYLSNVKINKEVIPDYTNRINAVKTQIDSLAKATGTPVPPVLSREDQEALGLVKRFLAWIKSFGK